MEARQRSGDQGRRLLGWRLRSDGTFDQLVANYGDLLRSEDPGLGLRVVEDESLFWNLKNEKKRIHGDIVLEQRRRPLAGVGVSARGGLG